MCYLRFERKEVDRVPRCSERPYRGCHLRHRWQKRATLRLLRRNIDHRQLVQRHLPGRCRLVCGEDWLACYNLSLKRCMIYPEEVEPSPYVLCRARMSASLLKVQVEYCLHPEVLSFLSPARRTRRRVVFPVAFASIRGALLTRYPKIRRATANIGSIVTQGWWQ